MHPVTQDKADLKRINDGYQPLGKLLKAKQQEHSHGLDIEIVDDVVTAMHIMEERKDELMNPEYKTFMGSRIFLDIDSRKQLPCLRPDEPVALWKILKNFIG
jgi:hypothetical protein